MNAKDLSEDQIVSIVNQVDTGIPISEVCKNHGISKSQFYKWRAMYKGMDSFLLKRMQELEMENKQLKKMYAEAKMESEMFRSAISDKFQY